MTGLVPSRDRKRVGALGEAAQVRAVEGVAGPCRHGVESAESGDYARSGAVALGETKARRRDFARCR